MCKSVLVADEMTVMHDNIPI